MRATHLVFALALAGVVAPAFAGGVGNDTLISGFGNDTMQPLDAPGGLAAAPSADAGSRTHRPIEFTTRLDGTIPLDAPGGLAAAPRPSMGGGHGAGKVIINDLNFTHWSSPAAAAAGRSSAPLHRQAPTGQSPDDYFDEDLPAGLTAEPTAKDRTFFSKVVRAGMELARREKEKQQAVRPLSEPVTFTAQVTTLPSTGLHDGLAARPAKPDDREVREDVSLLHHKIIWTQVGNANEALVGQGSGASPAGSSKPKEIVVVGSRLDTPVGMAATLPHAGATSKGDGHHMVTLTAHDIDRPIVVGRVPQPVAIPVSPAVPRAAGPMALPAKVEFGAAPALRR